jgi:hypothetical protein
MNNLTQIPSNITFETAITLTQSLLDQLEQGQSNDLSTWVTPLVTTQNGARGFFVAYLTDPRPFLDELYPALASALASAPDVVAELLVKNLAMSTAMEITHRRQDHPDLAQQSAQVYRRTAALIGHLNFESLTTEAQGLWQSIHTTNGPYTAFLQRWGYDAQQQQAIATSLAVAFPALALEVNPASSPTSL